SIEARVLVDVDAGRYRPRLGALLDEHHRVLRRDVELLAAGLAGHRVVDADHVVAELGVERAVAFVGAARQTILPRADDPAHLIVVGALAARARQLVGARLVPVVEEVAFVQRHAPIIARVGDRARIPLSGRYNWPMANEQVRTYPSELPV